MAFNYDDSEMSIFTRLNPEGVRIRLSEKDSAMPWFEIFRNDEEKKITFHSSEFDLPLEVIDKAIAFFDREVGRTLNEL